MGYWGIGSFCVFFKDLKFFVFLDWEGFGFVSFS